MPGDFTFQHVGLVVHDIERARAELTRLGYGMSSQRYVDARQGVDLLVMRASHPGVPALELVQPHRSDSVVSRLLVKHGAAPYHLCFEVGDIHEAVEGGYHRGYCVVMEPTASPVFDGRMTCFMYSKHLGLIELVERAGVASAEA